MEPSVHNWVHRSQQSYHIMNHVNVVNILTPYLSRINYNIKFWTEHESPNFHNLLRLSADICVDNVAVLMDDACFCWDIHSQNVRKIIQFSLLRVKSIYILILSKIRRADIIANMELQQLTVTRS
jgi:hypothetical protein